MIVQIPLLFHSIISLREFYDLCVNIQNGYVGMALVMATIGLRILGHEKASRESLGGKGSGIVNKSYKLEILFCHSNFMSC